jgi:membrane associated rhomboid family serine protease
MIPLSDENPTLRTPWVTYALLLLIALAWLLLQGAGLDPRVLAASVCELGLVAGELSGRAVVGTAIPIGAGMACVVDDHAINYATPITSMFLHGSWPHILGNALFLWVFGNNVEDSMGRLRFVLFYLLCGLVAAFAQVAIDPASPIPMVGASGAISGVMGAYLLLYPKVRVNMLFIFVIFIRVIPLPAWVVLVWWFALQLLSGLPDLTGAGSGVSSGVAVWAHIGGFVAGLLLIKLFENPELSKGRRTGPRRPASRWAR